MYICFETDVINIWNGINEHEIRVVRCLDSFVFDEKQIPFESYSANVHSLLISINDAC